jgi:FtsP/CotA-like multicopper oxidase with cupredoxin domain
MAAGRPEVWRIANVSANVTYRLALCSSRPEHDAGRTGTSTVPLTVCSRIPFQIINLDGARPWSLRQDQQGSVIVPDETEMVLMPGSRAEIVVTMPEPGKAYFAQMGFNMPDVWPATVLARLTVSRPVNAVPPLRLAFTRSDGVRATTTSPPMMAVPSYPEPECSGNCVLFRESGTVNAVLGKTVTPDGAEVLSIKVTRHDLEADPDFRDCLREREAADGSPNPKCHAFVGQPFDAARRDLVVKHRSTVAFRIYNATSEIHNFHVHQSKFNVTDVGPAPSAADSRPAAAAIRRSVSQRAASGPGGRVDIVDSVPVMSTTIETKDGADVFKDVTTITVEFTRPEQIGEFVFHCHILEHEDKGMMNTLTVYN